MIPNLKAIPAFAAANARMPKRKIKNNAHVF
jgi:hypothetical protein